ncbi:Mor transcription activator family protein [Lactiplantibacillus xiangfangensis]|uniref:Mor transcription activator domain-containing protein n=1 Tax=Lactiplantibacillus xiangfangensis TaxID=942150 RepID=A0A0R2MJL7_9LACO|nr:Mor transcription activator family protein [Lactiplantibacillus xiangfangensis]KRO13893.1 hypothetical protein IV64_GL001909 [Lactiplantibacillus xiangfangensis]
MENKIDIEMLSTFYRELNELLGTPAMLKFYQFYRGTQITLPVHLYDRKRVKAGLRAQYNGHNSNELAQKYGYSQRWVNNQVRHDK